MSTAPRFVETDEGFDYLVTFPYHEEAIAVWKETLPRADRLWDPRRKAWELSGYVFNQAVQVLLEFFPEVVVEFRDGGGEVSMRKRGGS